MIVAVCILANWSLHACLHNFYIIFVFVCKIMLLFVFMIGLDDELQVYNIFAVETLAALATHAAEQIAT